MASAPPSTEMEREAMCPICLECLTDPVTLDCRHNFCRGCITGYYEKRAKVRTVKCPLCKTRIQKGTLQPNWQLANIVEKIKLGKLTQGKENLCKKHNEKLQLFCKDDEELVCLICEHSPEHNQHSVLLLENAGQQYKEKIKFQQKSLEKERGNLVDRKLTEELKNQERLAQLEEEKQKISSVFQQMHTFLEEKEGLRLSQLDELKKEIEERHEENVTKLSKEISRLNKWIKKMERKCQQPAIEFLQNIGSTLKNYENKDVGHAVVLSAGLEESLRICSQRNTAIEKITEKYKEEAIRLMESYEAAAGTHPTPATGTTKKTDCQCRPLGPHPRGVALRPSGLRLTFQGEQVQTSRAPTLSPECYVGSVKEPTARMGKPPLATPTLPLCYICGQSSHIKWDCPFMDCLQAWTTTQAWLEKEGLWTEAEDDDLGLQGSEADASGQHQLDHMLTPDQEQQQQANFWTWTEGTVAPLFEPGRVCGVLCHHGPSRQEMLGQHTAPGCGDLAKTSGLSANSWQLPGMTGYQGFKGWDPVQGGDIKESAGAPKGVVEARKAEDCEGAGKIEDRGKKVQGESREGEMGKVSDCKKGEAEGDGARKEVQDDQGQQGGVRLQGQKESLGSSKEPGASKEGTRSKRLGQGLRLSGYSWSLGRGYKIIGHPLLPRAPFYTPRGVMELTSTRGHPAHSGDATPFEESQQAPA